MVIRISFFDLFIYLKYFVVQGGGIGGIGGMQGQQSKYQMVWKIILKIVMK